jgi:hypothetical protein
MLKNTLLIRGLHFSLVTYSVGDKYIVVFNCNFQLGFILKVYKDEMYKTCTRRGTKFITNKKFSK